MIRSLVLYWPLVFMEPTMDVDRAEADISESSHHESEQSHQPNRNPLGPDEFNDLIDKHTEPLMRAAFSIGFSEADAEELVQDTFITFLKAQERFEGRSKLSTYLFGILYNKAREMRRAKDKERSEEAIEELFDSQFQPDGHWNNAAMAYMSEPEHELHTHHVSEFLKFCLENLATQLRIAFTLKEIDDADTASICDILKLTPNHLGVLLFRARNQLRECLKSKIS